MSSFILGFVATFAPIAVAAAALLAAAWLVGRTRGGAAAKRAMLWTALAVTVGVLLWWTLALPYANNQGGGMNLVPLREIARAARHLDSPYGMINLYGNLIVFLPVGALVAWLSRAGSAARIGTGAAAGAALSIAIEMAQMSAGRVADIDDVLLNTTGALVGAGLAVAFRAAVYAHRAKREATAAD